MNTPLLDMDIIKEQFDETEPYEDYDGNRIKTIYLMNALGCPSHKYYMPWAHSNLENCPKCKGSGMILNKHRNAHKYIRAKHIQERLLSIASTYKKWDDVTLHIRQKIHKSYEQRVHWAKEITCDLCAGCGSLEARLDEDFWNQIDKELDEIGAWRHGSEGDGLDVMASMEVYR
jgi:hypothetical protein